LSTKNDEKLTLTLQINHFQQNTGSECTESYAIHKNHKTLNDKTPCTNAHTSL